MKRCRRCGAGLNRYNDDNHCAVCKKLVAPGACQWRTAESNAIGSTEQGAILGGGVVGLNMMFGPARAAEILNGKAGDKQLLVLLRQRERYARHKGGCDNGCKI